MASAFSTALDCHHLTIQQTDPKHLNKLFTKPINKRNLFTVHCNKPTQKNPSLSEQLKPLSTTTLKTDRQLQEQQQPSPKSTWLNPTKPRRSVISLQRQKRTPYTYNPKVKELKLIAQKLNECDPSESAFLTVLNDIAFDVNRENALLVLNGLRDWQKSCMFLNWLRDRSFFPVETIFYNVAMKALRYGRQFEKVEELAEEMVRSGVEMDNITYSTVISCAKRCGRFDKAVEWFERMYKTGLMPDEVTYSTVLDVYAKLGKVEEALSLYDRGRASGWNPDTVAFSVLARMFGEVGDYDGIRFVLDEMESVGVRPNVVVYNTLIEALGRAGKPGYARSLFEEMIESGLRPNEKTLTALIKIYGKARWGRDALELWERMKSDGWPMDFILFNTLLNMCADLALEQEAEKLFEDMKGKEGCKPDSWSYTAMLNIYGSGGNADSAMKLFEEMSEQGIQLNVMGLTCLIQCLGKAKRIDDLVRVFGMSIEKGIRPDDRLCGCLLSVVSLCEESEDADKVITCLEKANPKLVSFIKLLDDDKTSFDALKEEFKGIISSTAVDARRPFCNCLIDICRNKILHERAHELLYLGTLYGLYPGLHNRNSDVWSLDVRKLSVGAALTALEEWMGTLSKIVQRDEPLPELFSAHTGAGTHKFSQGLGNAFASHAKSLAAPFKQHDQKAGCFVLTREDLVSWVQSRNLSTAVTA